MWWHWSRRRDSQAELRGEARREAHAPEQAGGGYSGRGSGRIRRRRVTARPRVTRAVEAARMAQAGVSGELNRAWTTGPLAATYAPAALTEQREAPSAGLGSALAIGQPRWALSPALLQATTLAALAEGRAPQAVWEEALHDWLERGGGAREAEERTPRKGMADMADMADMASAVASPARKMATRRLETWHDIDETLRALRAS